MLINTTNQSIAWNDKGEPTATTPHYSLMLFDYHGEYTGDLKGVYAPADNAYSDANIVFDPRKIEDLLETRLGLSGLNYDNPARKEGETVVGALMTEIARKVLGEDLYTALEAEHGEMGTVGGYHWLIAGTREGLIRVFDQLFAALANKDESRKDWGGYGRPTGDDDVFDYWPNTMDMLWAFANDLDGIDQVEGKGEVQGWADKVQVMAAAVARLTFADDPSYCEWGRDWLPAGWEG